jgi:hypothetical protein
MIQKFVVNYALSILGSLVQNIGLPTLSFIMVSVGKAFGPQGCKHFSELTPFEQEELFKRAPVLRENHTDWPKPFQWVPRWLTCFVMPNDAPPPILAGTGTIEDIPEPGTYVVVDGYLALTTTSKWHARFGFRWDQTWKYLEFPSVTVKHLK